MDAHDIFLSYSSLDVECAKRLERKLAKCNINCFMAPKDIEGGAPFEDNIRSALLAASELFVLLSKNSIKSEWVITEWGAAWALKKHIIPLLYGCAVEEIPERLGKLQTRKVSEFERVIAEYQQRHDQRQQKSTPSEQRRGFPDLTTRFLLFDVDGTVLSPTDTIRGETGRLFTNYLQELAKRNRRFVFITGNDFNLQNERLLRPLIDQGLGPYMFCFSDGGSRAFEYKESTKTLEEISQYSQQTLMDSGQVSAVKDVQPKSHSAVPQQCGQSHPVNTSCLMARQNP